METTPHIRIDIWLADGNFSQMARTGYIRCRWEVEYWKGAGSMTYPTFTDSTGTFISVAAGGGYEQSDEPPSCYDSDDVCSNYTGSTNYGYSWFTDLANPYQNEYYYLGGEITITNLEGDGKYNVGVTHITYAAMFADVNTAPTGSQGET
ncbi:hypothetical protein N7490_011807 [Penicillium lividum]|nr:hypothetical protein N7490_011807 [Penicillium lividum]